MNKIINYFFDEEEKELIEDYKKMGIISTISLVITLLVIL